MTVITSILYILEELVLLGIVLAFARSLLALIRQKKNLLEAQEDYIDVLRRDYERL